MHTFYVPPPQIRNDTATITDSEQHHLRNVLRLTPGATIRIIDGQGNVYVAEVLNIGTHRIPSEAPNSQPRIPPTAFPCTYAIPSTA